MSLKLQRKLSQTLLNDIIFVDRSGCFKENGLLRECFVLGMPAIRATYYLSINLCSLSSGGSVSKSWKEISPPTAEAF
jgi:hypothetical protein